MATYSTGISATWDGSTFGEVTALSYEYGGTREGRDDYFIAQPGSLELTCLSSTGISTANVGKRGTLSVSGGGASLTVFAILESVGVEYELNGVTKFQATLSFTS